MDHAFQIGLSEPTAGFRTHAALAGEEEKHDDERS
jgi:hypothetical protein